METVWVSFLEKWREEYFRWLKSHTTDSDSSHYQLTQIFSDRLIPMCTEKHFSLVSSSNHILANLEILLLIMALVLVLRSLLKE